MITCEDDGRGIPPEEKEEIFGRGTGSHPGLGLFLVKEILGITGLSIRETGEYGRGARFEITIPRENCRVDGVPQKPTPHSSPLGAPDLRAPPTHR